MTSNTKIYRNIILRNSAYVPASVNVVLRASERITASPNFTTTGAGSFQALITNEGAYQYDAIGNLVLDRQEGAAISWTPYGKVRQVKTKGDSVVVDFRYDAAGNRVEKRVFTRAKTGATSVALTRYVRDASGNIMAVYADDEVPDVQWAGITGVTVSGTTFTKGATTSAWDAGLASVQKIPAGGNGWVQTTVGDSPAIDINTGRFFGLSATDADASYIGIQYGLYLVAGGALDVFESGLVRGRFGSYAAGDVLRVERVNTTVYYKRNGVVFYTSTVPSTTELLADFSFFHSGGRLLNVQFNFGEAPTEQPIYGSSRLGQYLGWRKAGQQRLGRKQFELTNHLGNVLAVVTDNINLNATTAWATVVSATDYYPFGLEMAGRSYQNEKYRYGFNGKEKDQKGEFGKTSYDYGFRIYNPTIAKFLSVDPLTPSYPWLTPYQFAGNMPLNAIDIDGLEPGIVFGSGNQVETVKKMPQGSNENYVAIPLKSLDQAYLDTKAHKEAGNKIEVIYFQVHGSPGSVKLGGGQDKVIFTEAVNPYSMVYTDDLSISGGDIEYYLGLSQSELKEQLSSNETLQTIHQFKQISELMEPSATIIMGGCDAAGNYEEDNYFGGDELLKALSRLTGRKVIANQDPTSEFYKGKFLDSPRTSERWFKKGWSFSLPEKNATEKTNKNLKLNGKGVLYEFVETN